MDKPDNTNALPPDKQPTNPDDIEAALASTLYLAGEALASDAPPEPVEHATPEDNSSAPIIDDFDWLKTLVAQFRQALADDPKRAELLHLLPSGFGDGEIMQVLFGNLFPAQRNRRKELRDTNGKKRLTDTQIEILRLTARGKTPAQLARERKCTSANVSNILNSIEQRLNTSSPQESVAVAMSMGYLPFDIMDWINKTARCAERNYSSLDTLVSYSSLEFSADPLPGQELAAFGLLLMLASSTAQAPQEFAANEKALNGVLYRLVLRPDGTAETRQIVKPGLLRKPCGLAIAPPAARREGFTPGHLYIAQERLALSGMNQKEIVELTPAGTFVRAFCGSRALGTNLNGTISLAFASTGALLATCGDGLLRFADSGRRVRRLNGWCGVDVCANAKGRLVHARFSGRGGSIGVYSETGKLLREFAPLPPGAAFRGVRACGKDEESQQEQFAALRVEEDGCKALMLICDVETGETRRCWQVPGAVYGAFAVDVRNNRLYVSCRDPASIAVYTREGTLQNRIALNAGITPRLVLLASDGALWLLASAVDTPPAAAVPLS